MKITLAIVSMAFATSHALSTTTTVKTSMDMLSNKFASTVAQQKPKFRTLQVLQVGAVDSDDPCWIATGELYETTTLSNAYEAWETDLEDIELGDSACVVVSQNRYECDFYLDSTTLPSHDDLVAACEQVGGQTYLQSDSISCNVVDFGDTSSFSYHFLSFPHCFASACDVEQVANDGYLLIDEAVVDDIEDGYPNSVDSVECNLLSSQSFPPSIAPSFASSSAPSASFALSSGPSFAPSFTPSSVPSTLFLPSSAPSTSVAPSSAPSTSVAPSSAPSISAATAYYGSSLQAVSFAVASVMAVAAWFVL
jgi:hypothetical protein